MANLRIFSGIVVFFVMFATSSCNSSVNMTEEEARAKARSLPLEKRYELYYKFYISRVPRNPALAIDVAELGPAARSYAFKMAGSGEGSQFGAALNVISAFHQGCTPQETRYLLQAVERGSTSVSQLEARKDSIRSVCARTPPPGWR